MIVAQHRTYLSHSKYVEAAGRAKEEHRRSGGSQQALKTEQINTHRMELDDVVVYAARLCQDLRDSAATLRDWKEIGHVGYVIYLAVLEESHRHQRQ